jgi:hypothetical protein
VTQTEQLQSITMHGIFTYMYVSLTPRRTISAHLFTHILNMPLEIQTVTKHDIADIAKLDCLAMKDAGISKTIWKVQAEEGIDVTASQQDFFATGMSHHGDTYWKVVDTETNDLVSVGKFVFQYHEGEQDMEVQEKEEQRKEQEANQRVANMFAYISRVPRQFAEDHYKGRPHACMMFTLTRPSSTRLTRTTRSLVSSNTSSTSKTRSSNHAA